MGLKEQTKDWGKGVPKELHDFRNFLFMVWLHLNLPKPTEIQFDIASYLQHGHKRRIIQAFRGVGKSWVTSAYVCWLLLMNPQIKILVVSASKERSDAFSTFTKRLIGEMPILQHLKPTGDQRDSNLAFDVAPAKASHAPSVKSVGITGQLTGSRANVIIADDIEVVNNSDTQLKREKLAELIKEFDAVLSPNGEVIYLGTPQTEESIYNLLPERGYEIRIWPARYPKDAGAQERYAGRLAPLLEDRLNRDQSLFWKPTDPARFGEQDLFEREASYGRSGFQLQFMLDTSLSDAERYPLKLADLIVMDLDTEVAPSKVVYASSPELIVQDVPNVGFTGDRMYRPMWVSDIMTPYQGRVLAIDPSGRGSDETGYAVVNHQGGMLYTLDCGGVRGGYDADALGVLVELAVQYKPNLILIESNFGDGMFTELFKPILHRRYKCAIEEVSHSKQKELRIIDVLEPLMNQHRLVMNKKVFTKDAKTSSKNNQLFYQMTRIMKQRGALLHDDRLDALSIAVAYWVEAMAKDTMRNDAEIREEMLTDLIENFHRHVFKREREDDSVVWSSYD